MLRTVLVFLSLTGVAAAQSRLALEFGVRGGLTTEQFKYDPPNHVTFGTSSFTEESRPGTFGPTVSLILHDLFEFRFEAVRKHVGYRFQSDLVVRGSVDSHSTSVSRGTSWEFPALVTYRFPGFTLRPFAGAGIGGGQINLTVTDSSTSTSPLTGVTTSASAQHTEKDSLFPVYGVVGFEKRMSLLSVRPELRLRQDLNSSNSSKVTTHVEFLVGLTIHPFHH